jgi:putative redox protein
MHVGKIAMQAKVSWIGQMRFVGSADTGHAVVMDSKASGLPPIGSSPMELVLMAMGACSSMDVVDILSKMRVELTSLEVEMKADRAKEPPRVFTKAELAFVASGEGLTDAAFKRAVDLSMAKYCSVAAMLGKGGVHLSHSSRVQDKVPPDTEAEGGRGTRALSLPGEVHPHAAVDLPFPGGGPSPRGKEA